MIKEIYLLSIYSFIRPEINNLNVATELIVFKLFHSFIKLSFCTAKKSRF